MLKLQTNFIRSLAVYRQRVVLLGYFLSFMFLLIAVWMLFHAQQLHAQAELASAKSLILQAELSVAKGKSQQFPNPAELHELKTQVDNFNQLFGHINMSAADLLSLLENITPKEARLVDLNYSARGENIRLTAASANNTALLVLMEAMQNHPQLSQVILLNRSEAEQNKEGLVQYQLRFSANY